jgi:hypothetical protein
VYYVVLCVVRAVHKFDFKFNMNEIHNKWRLVDRMSCSERVIAFQDVYLLQRPSWRVICAGRLHCCELRIMFGLEQKQHSVKTQITKDNKQDKYETNTSRTNKEILT